MSLDQLTPHAKVGKFILEAQLMKNERFVLWGAHHSVTSQEVSIKVYSKKFLAIDNNKEYFENDLYCLKTFFHPFIAKYITKLEDSKFVYIVLEPMRGGTFKELLEAKTRWNEAQARPYFVQLYFIIEYMQTQMNMIHGNLCLDILMVDENNVIRCVDFWGTQPNSGSAACGTQLFAPLPFQPPEYLVANSYSAAADFWDLGIFLYYCVVGGSPFPMDNKETITGMIVAYPNFLSQSIIDLFKKLITASPAHRYNTRDIKEHPWFAKTLYQLLVPFLAQNDQFSNEVFDSIKAFANEEQIQNELLSNQETDGVIIYNIAKSVYNANQVFKAISHISFSPGDGRKVSLDSDHSLTKSGSLSSFGSKEQVKVKPVALQLSRPVPIASRRGSKVLPNLPKIQ